MNTKEFTTKYEIDPDKVPLTTLEVQLLVALMSEYGFDKEFVEFIQQKGIDVDILRQRERKPRNILKYAKA